MLLAIAVALVTNALAPRYGYAQDGTGTLSVVSGTGSSESVTYEATRIADSDGMPIFAALDWEAVSSKGLAGTDLPSVADASGRDLVEAVSHLVEKDGDGSVAYELSESLVPGCDSLSIAVDAGGVEVSDGWWMLTSAGRRPLLAWVGGSDVVLGDKSDVPVLTKAVAGIDGEYGSRATFGSGNPLSYRIVMTLPRSMEGYAEYAVTIHDVWDSGLVLGNGKISVVLTHDGAKKSVDDAFQVSVTTRSITVSCEDVIAVGAAPGDSIIVSYQLAPDVDHEETVVNNGAWATYPSFDGEGRTVTSETTSYALRLSVIKRSSSDGSSLEAAEFALRDTDGRWLQENGSFGDESTRVVVSTDGDGVASFDSVLDAGAYQLVELRAPSGYRLPTNPSTTVEISYSLSEERIVLDASADGDARVTRADPDTQSVVVEVQNDPDTVPGTALLPGTGDARAPILLVGLLAAASLALSGASRANRDSASHRRSSVAARREEVCKCA